MNSWDAEDPTWVSHAMHHPPCYTISLVSTTVFMKEFPEWISNEGSGKYEGSWSFSTCRKVRLAVGSSVGELGKKTMLTPVGHDNSIFF